jgi:hypothetical protein
MMCEDADDVARGLRSDEARPQKGYPVTEFALSWIMALNGPMVWRHTGYDVIPYSYVVLPYGWVPNLFDGGEEDRLCLIESG